MDLVRTAQRLTEDSSTAFERVGCRTERFQSTLKKKRPLTSIAVQGAGNMDASRPKRVSSPKTMFPLPQNSIKTGLERERLLECTVRWPYVSTILSETEYSPFNRSPPSTRKKRHPRFFRFNETIHYDGKKAYKFDGEKWVRAPEYDAKR